MPSFADSIFLFVLALLLFGPKKLPVLARELGKWMGEFRRASNEFKMQMEEELRASEQADRQKQIVAMEAAAPIPPALNDPPEPEHPHLRLSTIAPSTDAAPVTDTAPASDAAAVIEENRILPPAAPPPENRHLDRSAAEWTDSRISPGEGQGQEPAPQTADGARPIPIATSGSLHMMPPATGLPTPRSSRPNGDALSSLLDSIPAANVPETNTPETESLAHGD